MIIAEDLTKRFDDFLAVDSLNLSVEPGQVLVILGPNGAGKTTTVRMLTSILSPTRGTAKVAGFDVIFQAERVRNSVGVLTEHHGLYSRMTMFEYLEFFGGLYQVPRDTIRKRVEPLIERFNLGDAATKRLGEYSKGMRQKLALVRAMVHDPPVLLLDEPTSAMDPESARTVRNSIAGLRSADRTIVLCTHNLTEAEELADVVAIIRSGKVVLSGPLTEIKTQLLGPPEFIAQFWSPLNGWQPDDMTGVKLSSHDDRQLRFIITKPEISNPILLKTIMDRKLDLISFQEVPRSLEQAYLEAIRTSQFADNQP